MTWGVGLAQNQPSSHHTRLPGLDPGPRLFFRQAMDAGQQGGWVYMMSNRYRGTIYVGVTAQLAERVHQHLNGAGSDFCAQYGLNRLVWAERGPDMVACIAQEKRMKRWRREWKFELIERGNPDWLDLSGEFG